MSVACFMIHATNRFWRSLRRYHHSSSDDANKCPGSMSYHNAHTPIGIVELEPDAEGYYGHDEAAKPPDTDPRWPSKCAGCDYAFTADDEYQLFDDHIYVDDSGREYSLREAPPGAMWYADWFNDWMDGPDGRSLVVVCPNGRHWMIDGPASNCTNKQDTGKYGQAHRCWVRKGVPPLITVGKDGHTCGAGGGSIQAGDYHGFLQNGHFT